MSRAYRDRIRLMKDVSAAGVQVPEYETCQSGFPCSIIPKSGFEAQRGRQIEANVSHVIELRFYDGFNPNDIIENEETDVRYEIKAVIDMDNLGRQMQIHANEVVV